MRLRKILMLPAVVSLLAIFAFGSVAPQEEGQVNDKVRELQDQYRRLLKNEYNPSTIEPKTNGKPSFGAPGWMKSSKSAKGKKSKRRKYAKKKRSSPSCIKKGAVGQKTRQEPVGQKVRQGPLGQALQEHFKKTSREEDGFS